MKLQFSPTQLVALFFQFVFFLSQEGQAIEFEIGQLAKEAHIERPSSKETPVHLGGEKATDEKKILETAVEHCFADEQAFDDEIRPLMASWQRLWKNENWQGFAKHLDKDFVSNPWKRSGEVVRKVDSVEEIAVPISYKTLKKDEAIRGYKRYFAGYDKIEDLSLDVTLVRSPRGWRSKGLDLRKVELHVRLDVRGFTEAGRRNDRGMFKATLVRKAAGEKYKISEIELWKMESLQKAEPLFKLARKQVLPGLSSYQREEAIRRGGYALAIDDYDGDDIADMYVGAMGAAQLYRGIGNGQYQIVQDSGLGPDKFVKSAVFADFNNDGKKDLLVVRFIPSQKLLQGGDIKVYKNIGSGKFKPAGKVLKTFSTDYAMPAAVADFNQDGFLDFYVGFPGNKDFTSFQGVRRKPEVQVQGLFINKGEFSFKADISEKWNIENFADHSHMQKLFPHSSLAVDFDKDGHMDILVIDDRGNLSPAYRNLGKGKFHQVAETIGIENRGYGMGVAQGDLDNDGYLEFALTNVNFVAQDRFQSSCMANWYTKSSKVTQRSLHLYKSTGRAYQDIAKSIGLEWAGEGLAGVEFFDYNNDGFQDIYVSNGLWSGTDRDFDLGSLFIRSMARDREISLALGEGKSETQSLFMKLLKTSSKKGLKPHLAGFQRNRLFRNNQDGTFTEVGFLEGVDSMADGYMVARADIDNDGDLDIVLRNGDPGVPQVHFPAVQIFMNQSKRDSLRLKLVGKKSNPLGIGAWVKVVTDKTKQVRNLTANNGAVQSEPILHFGLGNEKVAKLVEITWPSGHKQVMRNLNAGYHVIVESRTMKVSSN